MGEPIVEGVERPCAHFPAELGWYSALYYTTLDALIR